jgi:hypothetical protein
MVEPRDRSLRVGDKEREAVGKLLREHHVEGRLDADEFQSRLEQSLAAKTYADLDVLVADLPGAVPERRSDGRYRRRHPFPIPFPLVPLALVGLFVIVGHGFGPIFPLLFVFVVVRRLV